MALHMTNFHARRASEETASGDAEEIVQPFWLLMDQHCLVAGQCLWLPVTELASVPPEKKNSFCLEQL